MPTGWTILPPHPIALFGATGSGGCAGPKTCAVPPAGPVPPSPTPTFVSCACTANTFGQGRPGPRLHPGLETMMKICLGLPVRQAPWSIAKSTCNGLQRSQTMQQRQTHANGPPVSESTAGQATPASRLEAQRTPAGSEHSDQVLGPVCGTVLRVQSRMSCTPLCNCGRTVPRKRAWRLTCSGGHQRWRCYNTVGRRCRMALATVLPPLSHRHGP